MGASEIHVCAFGGVWDRLDPWRLGFHFQRKAMVGRSSGGAVLQVGTLCGRLALPGL